MKDYNREIIDTYEEETNGELHVFVVFRDGHSELAEVRKKKDMQSFMIWKMHGKNRKEKQNGNQSIFR